jgi:hypothetical protein
MQGLALVKTYEAWLFRGFCLMVPVIMASLSFDFGPTFDEVLHIPYAQYVYNYFATLGADDRALHFFNLDLYGGLFELLCEIARRHCPNTPIPDVRHVINALFGATAIVCTAILGRRCIGVKAGWLAAALLLLSPRFVGHSMNNPKDIPFTAFAALTLWAIVTRLEHPGRVRLRDVLLVATAAGLAVGLRAGGLFLLGYAVLYLGLRMVETGQWPRRPGQGLRLAALVALMLPATLLVGSLFWPYALRNPFINVFAAAAKQAHFTWSGSLLYMGEQVQASRLPWHYVSFYFLITLPVSVPIGCLLSFAALARPDGNRSCIVLLWFSVLFPLVSVVVMRSTIYDGIRHFLFVYPSLVLLAAFGWREAWRLGRARFGVAIGSLVVSAVFLGTSVEPARYMLVNHPNQVVFFNELIGGVPGAYKRFELDYWHNHIKQELRFLERFAAANKGTVTVESPGFRHIDVLLRYYQTAASRVLFPSDAPALVRLEILREGLSSPSGRAEAFDRFERATDILHVVRVDGVPLGYLRLSPRDAVLDDLATLVRALERYRQDHGVYPRSRGWDGRGSLWGENTEAYIPDLVPDYLPALPLAPYGADNPYGNYLYVSDGRDYKLLPRFPPDATAAGPNDLPEEGGMQLSLRGYWTPGAADWRPPGDVALPTGVPGPDKPPVAAWE